MGASGTHADRYGAVDRLAPAANHLAQLTDAALIGTGGEINYVGIENYLYALTDPDFLASILRTLYFTVVSVALEGIIGVLVALLLNQSFMAEACCACW